MMKRKCGQLPTLACFGGDGAKLGASQHLDLSGHYSGNTLDT